MDKLMKKLKILPNDSKLYKIAFCHTSYVNEHHLKSSYERLEFLGDAIVDLVVADYLYNNMNIKEGDMTKLRASYVCENALYEYAMDLGFSEYIKVGNGEEHDGGKFKKAIVADIFEAFMAAVYLDLGYETVRRVILDIVTPYIENPNIIFFSDYKSALQEAMQTDKRELFYELVKEEGPSHQKQFTIEVKIDGILYGRGTARSKKEAEQEAAHDALNKLAINRESKN